MAIAIYNDENLITEIRPGNAPEWVLPDGKNPPNFFVFSDAHIEKYCKLIGVYQLKNSESGDVVFPSVGEVDEISKEIEKELRLKLSDLENREIRKKLFSDADIEVYKLEDAGIPASEWRSYRQQLRDITEHENWPELKPGDWPTPPE